MSDDSDAKRLEALVALLLEIADGNYEAHIEPSEAGDTLDALINGTNMVAESLALERQRRREAEALLRDEVHAYEHAPAMFCSISVRNFEIVKCNETLANTLGTPKSSLLQRRLLGFLPLAERPAAEQALHALRLGQVPKESTFHLQTGQRRIPFLLSGAPANESASRLRLILRDVSRERSLEAQLRQAQKLEAVGRLASGVAHDFNNILAVILGSSTLLEHTLDSDHPGLADVRAITSAAENASGVTQQLLALSKPTPNEPARAISLPDALAKAEPLLRQSLGPRNELRMESSGPVPKVCVEPGELVQVILNLTVNARDAMPRGGTLLIRSSLRGAETDAPQACLDITDTGEGMTPKVLDQVLEPFFTTKAKTGGSGLGLSVCARLVDKWRGAINIESHAGGGTSVQIVLPAAQGPETEARERTTQRGRRILVVDDDPLVRDVIVRTLEAEGYEVLSADGLNMAVEFAKGSATIDVLVTDIVMPGASGTMVANALWQSMPDLPVLFMSGYTGNRVSPDLMNRENVRFLGKPFQADMLLNLIAEFV